MGRGGNGVGKKKGREGKGREAGSSSTHNCTPASTFVNEDAAKLKRANGSLDEWVTVLGCQGEGWQGSGDGVTMLWLEVR